MLKYLKVATTHNVVREDLELSLGENLVRLARGMGVYLRGVNVRNKVISNTDFSYLSLESSDFLFCKFVNCDFTGTDLTNCDFHYTTFENCNFVSSNLGYCNGDNSSFKTIITCRYTIVVTRDYVWLDSKRFPSEFFFNRYDTAISDLPKDNLDNVMSKIDWATRYFPEVVGTLRKLK